MPVSSAKIEIKNSRWRLCIEFHDEISDSGTSSVVSKTSHKLKPSTPT